MTGSVTRDVRVSAKRRGYVLAAGMLLIIMLGGTLPVPLYVLYEKQMGFGPLGVTVVFACLARISQRCCRHPRRRPLRPRERTLTGCVMWPCAAAAQSGSRCRTRAEGVNP
jgi:hypothetical protein